MKDTFYYIGPFVACQNSHIARGSGGEEVVKVPLDYSLPEDSDLFRTTFPFSPDSWILDWQDEDEKSRFIEWHRGQLMGPARIDGSVIDDILEWFKDEYAEEIDTLKRKYGESKVEIKFGLVSHCCPEDPEPATNHLQCQTCKYWRRIREIADDEWPGPHGECEKIDEDSQQSLAWTYGSGECVDPGLITMPTFGCVEWTNAGPEENS